MSRQPRTTPGSAARSPRTLLALAGMLATLLVALTPGTAQADDPSYGADAISVGGFHTCALSGDAISCWGRNDNGQLDVPAGSFTQVSAGRTHTCALRTDRTVACWGDNAAGQAAAPGGSFTEVSAGGRISCALRTDGTGVCWGADAYSATQVPSGTFTQISAGAGISPQHACGLRPDGSVVCWGGNVNGQANAPAGAFVQVSAGGHHSCAIRTDGTGTCWGYNALGQAPASLGPNWASVSSGGFHNCGLREDGTVTCWGMNYLGEGSPPGGQFIDVAVSDEWATAARGTSCGVRPDRTIACWGDGIYGQRSPWIQNAAPSGQVGAPYDHGYATSPVVPAMAFNVASGTLPPGLAIAADGSVSGTPTAAGTFEFRVCAANGIAPTACADLAIQIADVVPTSTTVTAAPDPAELGEPIRLDAVVSSDGEDPPTGTIAFTADGEELADCSAVPVTEGAASCTTTSLGVGDHDVAATYSGDAGHEPSAGSTTASVTKVRTTLTASRAFWLLPTFRATLTRTRDGAPLAGHRVTFRVGSTTVCTATTNADGRASCGALALFLGRPTYSATFAGTGTLESATAQGAIG